MIPVNKLGISPHPWHVSDKGVPKCIIAADGAIVCTIDSRNDDDDKMLGASTRMYDALQRIVHWAWRLKGAKTGEDRQACREHVDRAINDGLLALRAAGGSVPGSDKLVPVGCIGFEIRFDKDDDGTAAFDVYELYNGDSEFCASFYGLEDAREYIRDRGWRGEINEPVQTV